MAPQLCTTCLAIPADFWCHSYDLKEYIGEISQKLQSLECMRMEARNGCQFCAILLCSLHDVQVIDGYQSKGDKEMLYLRRSRAFPDRAVAIGIGGQGRHQISRTYFSRIPLDWAKPSRTLVDRSEAQGVDMPSHTPIGAREPIDNLDLMRAWLQTCRNGHSGCLGRRTKFLPTRLLDVRADRIGLDIRLVLTEDMVRETSSSSEYLTLSHCWGPKHLHSVTTEIGNLAKRLERIPFADLSKTFQDAVQITRKLGQRYLWIDSLCIVQDDRNDWAKEAALMAEVYGSSLCTLAALSSRDGTAGCNRVADIQKSTANTFIDLNWNRKRHPYIRVFEKEPRNWHNEYDGGLDGNNLLRSPLRHRAWVLQEKELSRRSIHFGEDQLLWECQEIKATAQLPWEEWKREEDLIYKREWYELVEDYTLRSITAATDKLPALSGLAKRYQESSAQYLAGIWSSQLPGALLWQSRDPSALRTSKTTKDDTYIAPSWSWASVQGQISYDSQRLLLPVETYPDPLDNPSRKWDRIFRETRLERAVTALSMSSNPYGAVDAASIILSGAYIIPVDLPPQGSKEESEPLTIRGNQIGLFYRDTADALTCARYAFFLALQDEPLSPLVRNEFQSRQAGRMIDLVMGVVLVKDTHHSDVYQRAGLARWVDAGVLAKTETQTVKLV